MTYTIRILANLLDLTLMALGFSLVIYLVSRTALPTEGVIKSLYYGLLLFHFLYHTAFELLLRATPAKLLFRLTTAHASEGHPLKPIGIINRNAVRTLEFMTGYLFMPLTLVMKKTPHEYFSNTITKRNPRRAIPQQQNA